MARRSLVRREKGSLLQPTSPRTARLVSLDAEAAALRELREGLARKPHEIPCKYFYDDRGSALFEQIPRRPEYYPTPTERALLIERARAIVETAGGQALSDVVELGSGAAEKTVCLLDAALAAGGRPRCVAGAISARALQRPRPIPRAARPDVRAERALAAYAQTLRLRARRPGC